MAHGLGSGLASVPALRWCREGPLALWSVDSRGCACSLPKSSSSIQFLVSVVLETSPSSHLLHKNPTSWCLPTSLQNLLCSWIRWWWDRGCRRIYDALAASLPLSLCKCPSRTLGRRDISHSPLTFLSAFSPFLSVAATQRYAFVAGQHTFFYQPV